MGRLAGPHAAPGRSFVRITPRVRLETESSASGATGDDGSRRPAAPRPDRVRARRRHALHSGRPQAEASSKLRRIENARARPDVTILVDHYEEDWDGLWWIRLRGRARVLDHGKEREHALALLQEKYPQYRTEPPDGSVLAVDMTEVREWRAAGRSL